MNLEMNLEVMPWLEAERGIAAATVLVGLPASVRLFLG
jgi:hypothetical protein